MAGYRIEHYERSAFLRNPFPQFAEITREPQTRQVDVLHIGARRPEPRDGDLRQWILVCAYDHVISLTDIRRNPIAESALTLLWRARDDRDHTDGNVGFPQPFNGSLCDGVRS